MSVAFSAVREWMVLSSIVPFGRLPIIANLVESGQEVCRPEVFISSIGTLAVIRVVEKVFLAVRNMMSVVAIQVMRPMWLASVSRVCVKLVKLVTIGCAILGRGNKKLSESSLWRLLRTGRERRRW